jgi:uncharacterized protein YbbC (DUF1343 family)
MSPFFNRRRFLKAALVLPGLGAFGLQPLKAAAATGFRLGIDAFTSDGFAQARGQRVGLLTHPAGVNRHGELTMDVLHRDPRIRLVALFGPEHGIYGDEKANIPVDDRIDSRTGLPVYSLYGKYRRPTEGMLEKIDTMVIDLQDIGSRSYTYVSCMRYVIEECFKHGKSVIVLDRPNPLGGLKVDGPPLEPAWMSYVGAFRVPYVHGLTIGELATFAVRQQGVLEVNESVRRRGRLTVVPMRGWRRSMMWPETGLKWIPTSPAIPDLSAVMGYPMTGLGTQLGAFSHGYGTRLPFRLLQYPQTAPEKISAALEQRRISGLSFPIIPFEEKGQPRRATYVRVDDWQRLNPTELSLHMMALACAWGQRNPFASASEAQQGLFNKHVGDSRVLEALIRQGAQIDIAGILRGWQRYNSAFRESSRRFHLYPA